MTARGIAGCLAIIALCYVYLALDDWQRSLRPQSFAARWAPAIEMLR